MNTTTNQTESRAYRPKLALYHPNARGTGSAVRLELLPATDDAEGCIMLTIAGQSAVGDRRAPTPTYARFDWENKIVVKLGFTDLCQILQVFRGECESLGDGLGLVHISTSGTTKIVLRHLLEPRCGYSLEVYRTSGQGDSNGRVFLSPNEALGLSAAIEGSLSVICFGIPMAQAVSAERAGDAAAKRGKEAVDAAAA